MSLATATHGYGVSFFFCNYFSDSDTRNVEYITGLLTEISLEQLLFQ